MALINREALKRCFENYQKDCDEAGDAVAVQVFTDCIAELEDAPTVDPIHAAGGCYCKDCRYSHYDTDYNKRWCKHGSGCREVKADGSGFCDRGKPREAQEDE